MHAVACYEIDGSSHRAPLGRPAEQLYPEKNEVTWCPVCFPTSPLAMEDGKESPWYRQLLFSWPEKKKTLFQQFPQERAFHSFVLKSKVQPTRYPGPGGDKLWIKAWQLSRKAWNSDAPFLPPSSLLWAAELRSDSPKVCLFSANISGFVFSNCSCFSWGISRMIQFPVSLGRHRTGTLCTTATGARCRWEIRGTGWGRSTSMQALPPCECSSRCLWSQM